MKPCGMWNCTRVAWKGVHEGGGGQGEGGGGRQRKRGGGGGGRRGGHLRIPLTGVLCLLVQVVRCAIFPFSGDGWFQSER